MCDKKVMYSIRTLRNIVRIPLDDLVRRFDTKYFTPSPIALSYPDAVELEAYVKGEIVTDHIIEHVRAAIVYSQDDVEDTSNASDDYFSFACSDGLYESTWNKHTLARHFHLIEDYISEYTEDTSIPISSQTVDEVTRTLDTYFGMGGDGTVGECLDVLNLLNPKSQWAYFESFGWDLPAHSLLALSKPFTYDDLSSFLESFSLDHGADNGVPMLRGPPGYSMLSKMRQANLYCSMRWRDAIKLFPTSFVAGIQAMGTGINPILLKEDFSEYAGVPNETLASRIREALYAILDEEPRLSPSLRLRLMTMLGMRVPLLGNETTVIYAPYQLIIPVNHTELFEVALRVTKDEASAYSLAVELDALP